MCSSFFLVAFFDLVCFLRIDTHKNEQTHTRANLHTEIRRKGKTLKAINMEITM